MTVIVCDASLIANLILSDEWSAAVPRIAAIVADAETCAPAHFPLEIGSLLVTAERCGRIIRSERLRCLDDARIAVAEIDAASLVPSREITDLAVSTGLSVYDAAYLELALRRSADLASNDRKLVAAARTLGIAVVTVLS